MWLSARIQNKQDPAALAVAHELLTTAFRALVFALAGASLVWTLISGFLQPDATNIRVAVLSLLIFLNTALALRIMRRQFLMAQILWQIGVLGIIILAIYVFQEPMVALFLAFCPLLATATLGWPAGFATEGLLILTIVWLFPVFPSSVFRLAPFVRTATIFGGAVAVLVGWATTHVLLNMATWALVESQQARARMRKAFEQRMELKQAQEDLIQANKELARLSNRLRIVSQIAEEARQAKQRFVANVSHELRTPLNMVIGFSEMIPKLSQVYGAELPPALLSDIDAIRRNSQHLARLVDDVLDLSQMEAGRMVLSKEWCSLEEILNEAIVAVRVLFESKGLYLNVNITPNLPEVFCDSTRVRQVILNLLSNAGRFTKRGGVIVQATQHDDKVQVCVTDTGPGIEKEKQKRLFEPFEQLNGSIRRRYGGSGLGLSISKQFVKMHAGEIWVSSELGEGTTFCFTIPIRPLIPTELDVNDARRWFNPYESTEFRVRTRRSLAPMPEIPPRFVLLDTGKALHRLFSHYANDVEFVSVKAIEDAIVELQRSPAQALVANTSPYEDNTHLLHQLNNLPNNTPAITCWVPGFGAAAQRLGVSQYLLKPVTREALLSALEDLDRPIKTVLLVDDEPEALRLFTRMLSTEPANYSVLQTTNGQRALSLLEERQPDAMLLDLIMPGVDGFEVIQTKNQNRGIADIPIIVVSSRDPTGDPIVSNTLSVAKSGGLSGRDLMACVQAISQILSLETPSADPAHRVSSPGPTASAQKR